MNLPDPGMFYQVRVSEHALDTQEDDMADRGNIPGSGISPANACSSPPSDTKTGEKSPKRTPLEHVGGAL
jgi:hypothetical protein